MAERKPHLRIDEFPQPENYASRRKGRPEQIPLLDRAAHGQALLGQYATALGAYAHRRAAVTTPITQETGLYLELTSVAGCKLPLARLDTARDYRLQSLHNVGNVEVAILFVPDSRRATLQRKLQAYLDRQRDSTNPGLRRSTSSVTRMAAHMTNTPCWVTR